MMSRTVVQCRHCGYLTSGTETVCLRCHASLADAEIVAGGAPEPLRDEGPILFTHESVSGHHSDPSMMASFPSPPSHPPVPPPTRTPVPHAYGTPQPYYAPPPKQRRSIGVFSISVILLILAAVGATVGLIVFNFVKKTSATASVRSELRVFTTKQPDFTATAEGNAGPAILNGKMVQHGDRLYMTSVMARSEVYRRSEVGVMDVGMILEKGGQITVVIPELKQYTQSTQGSSNGGPLLTLKEELAAIVDFPGIDIERLPDDVVSGYNVQAYKVVDQKDRGNTMYVSVAPALDNLIVKCTITWKGKLEEDVHFTLRDVSLNPDLSVFDIPVTYTKTSQ
jgi:hypothetical protein